MKRWILVLFGAALWVRGRCGGSQAQAGRDRLYRELRPRRRCLRPEDGRHAPRSRDSRPGLRWRYDRGQATSPSHPAPRRAAGPVVISKANESRRSPGRFRRRLPVRRVRRTTSVVQLFDRDSASKSRPRSAATREPDGDGPSAPLLAKPQLFSRAGGSSRRLGFAGRCGAQIIDGDGRPVASGRGSGTLGPPPKSTGSRASIRSSSRPRATPCAKSSMSFRPIRVRTFRPRSAIRRPPSPCARLRSGAWYAAEDPAYLLEALQHVAPEAGSSRPARLLALAFIEGKRPPPPRSVGRGEDKARRDLGDGRDASAAAPTR